MYFVTQKRITIFISSTYLIGLIGYIIPAIKPLMLTLTPYVLFVAGVIVLYFALKKDELKLLLWCLLVYLLIFTLEGATKSGIIFGSYNYTPGPKLFGVPLITGFNGMIVILGAVTIAGQIDRNIFLTALLTGTLAVLFDIMLEPAALKLGYWKWNYGLIPLANYYAWFGISLLAAFLYDIFKIKTNEKLSETYFMVQLIFLILLYFFI